MSQTTLDPFSLSCSLNAVRETTPLVHCITNYVTVNDCANALLACGASPIMSDDPLDVEEITSICSGLVLNIGTLNAQTIAGMHVAAQRATELGHPIVLDPVGAGASKLRTETASSLLDAFGVTVVRGNASEIKALSGVSVKTRGVDVDPVDVIDESNSKTAGKFASEMARRTGAIVAITGALDVVADDTRAFVVRNGSPLMGRITGAGCTLSAVCGAYIAARSDDPLAAILAAVTQFGVAGEVAAGRMAPEDGNGSFRTYLLDALFNMNTAVLEARARVEEL